MESFDTLTSAEVSAVLKATPSTIDPDTDAIISRTQDYYNKEHIFQFYIQVYGGEFLHVGLYSMLEGDDANLQGVPRISKACSISTRELLSRFFPSDSDFVPEKCTVMDMGAGFGGTARVAAKEFGCKVICIEISKKENDFNASLTKTAGLEDKVIIPGEKSFFETGVPDSSCEVVFAQDALHHGGSQRHRIVEEAARVLKPGGRMVFADVMISDDATPEEVEKVSKREGTLENLGSVKFYKKWGKVYGLEFVDYVDHPTDLSDHYETVSEVMLSFRGEQQGKHDEFIDHTVKDVRTWSSGARSGLIRWGFMVFKKSVATG